MREEADARVQERCSSANALRCNCPFLSLFMRIHIYGRTTFLRYSIRPLCYHAAIDCPFVYSVFSSRIRSLYVICQPLPNFLTLFHLFYGLNHFCESNDTLLSLFFFSLTVLFQNLTRHHFIRKKIRAEFLFVFFFAFS